MLGAILLLLTKSVSLDGVLTAFTTNNAVNPLKILVLFITMTILSIFLDEVGFFKYLAKKTEIVKVIEQFNKDYPNGVYITYRTGKPSTTFEKVLDDFFNKPFGVSIAELFNPFNNQRIK